MIPLGQSVLTLILAVSAGGGYAQALQDPMRPPGFAFPSGAGPGAMAPSGPVLQSTLVSNGRRIAMIDGKPMKIGDIIGDAKIVAIDSPRLGDVARGAQDPGVGTVPRSQAYAACPAQETGIG